MNQACKVAGCRYLNHHRTSDHECGTCHFKGHGQRECGNIHKINNLNHIMAREEQRFNLFTVNDYQPTPKELSQIAKLTDIEKKYPDEFPLPVEVKNLIRRLPHLKDGYYESHGMSVKYAYSAFARKRKGFTDNLVVYNEEDYNSETVKDFIKGYKLYIALPYDRIKKEDVQPYNMF